MGLQGEDVEAVGGAVAFDGPDEEDGEEEGEEVDELGGVGWVGAGGRVGEGHGEHGEEGVERRDARVVGLERRSEEGWRWREQVWVEASWALAASATAFLRELRWQTFPVCLLCPRVGQRA